MSGSALFRSIVPALALGLLAGCSSGTQSTLTGSPSLQNHAKTVAQIQRALHEGNPFTVRGDVFARIGRSNGVNPKFPRVSIPDKNKKPPKWPNSIFVSDYEGGPSYQGAVYQFSPIAKKAKVIGTITDSLNPQGLDSDAQTNLYVAATGSFSVNIYTPETYTASTILSDTGGYPVSVGVGPDGTVYASNIYNASVGPGNIEIYAPGSLVPTGVVPDTNIDSARFLAVDSAGTLWYDYLDASGYTGVASYAPAYGTVTEYGSLGVGFPGGVRITDQGYLAISDQYVGVEYFHDPPQQGDPFATFTCGGMFSDPVSFSLQKGDKHMFVADAGTESLDACGTSGKNEYFYSVGTGTFVVPVDAYVIPAGNT